MQDSRFKVIFCGQIKDGFNPEDVAHSLSTRFKIPLNKAQKLVSAGREFTLNKGAEHRKAYGIKSLLEEMGMEARLERVVVAPPAPEPEKPAAVQETAPVAAAEAAIATPAPAVSASGLSGLSLIPMDNEKPAADPATAPAVENTGSPRPSTTAASGFACPKCETAQPKGEICVSCGVVFAKIGQTPPPTARSSGRRPVQTDDDGESFWDGAKGKIAGAGGGLIALLFIAKKFKLIKLAAIFGIASYGYMFDDLAAESKELCLGDVECVQVVEDKAEACWDTSGLAEHDWDAMDENEFDRIYYDVEKNFFGCFYDGQGRRLFLQPTYLHVWMADMCAYDESCMLTAASQRHACYDESNLGLYSDDLSRLDDYSILEDRGRELKRFFGCFRDSGGSKLFPDAADYFG